MSEEYQLVQLDADPVALMTMGGNMARNHPDWALAVRDSERRIIWTTQKNVPGKAEDATKQNS